jgi:exo beta-1,2-glucooligosaccharide sophorohydrolase (non-reducing end)
MTTERRRSATSLRLFHGVFCLFLLASVAYGDTEYYRHVLFDNSLELDAYFYSEVKASAPSTLELDHDKLPVSRKVFFTPPNALRLKWRSVAGGGWDASVRAIDFRNRQIAFRGDTLYFWCYSEEGIAGQNLPAIRLQDAGRNFSAPLDLGKFATDFPAKKWIQVRVPLDEFKTGSIHAFEPGQTERIVFSQNAADGNEHILLIDEINIDDPAAAAAGTSETAELPAPQNVSANGYERHVDVRWDAVVSPELRRYVIGRCSHRESRNPFRRARRRRGRRLRPPQLQLPRTSCPSGYETETLASYR